MFQYIPVYGVVFVVSLDPSRLQDIWWIPTQRHTICYSTSQSLENSPINWMQWTRKRLNSQWDVGLDCGSSYSPRKPTDWMEFALHISRKGFTGPPDGWSIDDRESDDHLLFRDVTSWEILPLLGRVMQSSLVFHANVIELIRSIPWQMCGQE